MSDTVNSFPVQLQGTGIESLHYRFLDLKAELTTAESKLQTGTYSLRNLLNDILNEMDDLIPEMRLQIERAIVPKGSFSDFEAGTRALNEWADYDVVAYYSGLIKSEILLAGFRVALLQITDAPAISRSGGTGLVDDGTLDTVTEEEFTTQGYLNPTVEATPDFLIHIVRKGDDLMKLAARYFGDHLRWIEIQKFNQIDQSGLDDLMGTAIKIPLDTATLTLRREGNLVFAPYFSGTDQAALDAYLYGRDIKLVNKKLVIDGSGNLATIEGVANVVEAVRRRTMTKKGLMTAQLADYGIMPIDNREGLPFAIFYDKLFADIQAQSASDPRVLGAEIDASTLQITGPTLRVKLRIRLSGGTMRTVPLTNPQLAAA